MSVEGAPLDLHAQPVDEERLASYLDTLDSLRAWLPMRSVARIGAGQSNLTFRVTLDGGSIILRRPPLGPLPPKAHDVLREHRVMQALTGSTVPVPSPLAACDDTEVLGAPFFLMEDVPGDAIRLRLPSGLARDPSAPHAIAFGAVDALSALHKLDPASVGLGDLSRPTGYITRQVGLWQRQLDYARVRPVPDLDWATGWLQRNLPIENTKPRIVHGDYKLDNVLFPLQPPVRVLAVVDWEMAALGDPLADLGWLLAFWCEDGTPPSALSLLPRMTEDPTFPRRHGLATRYAERTGADIRHLHFYVVLALWKMAILLEGHWARHIRGTAGGFDFTYLERGGPLLATYIRLTAEQSDSSE